MPNEYSIEIHNHLSNQIDTAARKKESAQNSGDSAAKAYWEGHLEELLWLRNYLGEHVDLKDFRYY